MSAESVVRIRIDTRTRERATALDAILPVVVEAPDRVTVTAMDERESGEDKALIEDVGL